jgi:hypothetical protein
MSRPKRYKRSLLLRLSDEAFTLIDAEMQRLGWSRSEWIRDAIDARLAGGRPTVKPTETSPLMSWEWDAKSPQARKPKRGARKPPQHKPKDGHSSPEK